ncbi:MAG TPA: hypothetical protein VEJ20_05905 [Candidatus Eremiobacteraceae bacterium]|nr:hypothetical protein [Candidatus Eremiobacteraceae bacterium]
MKAMQHVAEHKTFSKSDEVREFPNGRVELLAIGGAQIGRLTLQPGWRWSKDVKPIANTASCEAPHCREFIAGPGDITSLPQGHDAWVVGNEPVVVVDWYGASKYAKGE